VPQPGEEVTGVEAIRDALQQFAALKPRLRGEITNVLTAGDVALVHNRWQLEAPSPTAV
jgi:ketosteroid isomerase-like protein